MLNKTRILTNNTTKNKKIQKFLYFGFILIFPIFLLTPFILFSQTSQSYTSSGTYSWTCPAGITKVDVECWGGGGAGGGNTTTYAGAGGGGGGGGAYSKKLEITVVPGTIYTVTVGAGGKGSIGNGANGGDSWFNNIATILAKGGNGGKTPISGSGGLGGAGGSASSGIDVLSYSGGNGGNGSNSLIGLGGGGGGGSSAGTATNGNNGGNAGWWSVGTGGLAPTGGGAGANGGNYGNNGENAFEFGGGGGGSGDNTWGGGNVNGGNGYAGKVYISWAPRLVIGDNNISASDVCSEDINIPIHGFTLTGINNGGNLTGVSFLTNGTYSVSDITNFKLYYTTTAVFETTNLLATINTPSVAGKQTFPAISKAVANETIYFWITMDVASSVTSGHTITASVLNSSHLTASVTLSGSALASGTQTIYDCKPEAPVFYNFGSEDFILFNNAAFYMEEPRFRLSSTHTSAINMFYIEINTASDFTGTFYFQSFSGTYESGMEYDFLCDGLSSSLPTTENVTYYVRAKSSDNAGSTWSSWSTGTYSFTFTSSTIPEWHQTTTAQFFTNTLSDCESSSNKVLMPTTVMSTQKVSSDNDDGYELEGSTVWITEHPNNRLGYRLVGINRNYIAGIRFASVPIPKDAVIVSSSVSLYSYANKSATVKVTINGIDEDNTSTFTTQKPSAKTKTTASSGWTLQNPWTVDNWYTSSSINSSVQAIVNRSGWDSGHAMGFIFTNNGSGDNKQFVDYGKDKDFAPKLDISYIVPSATIISTPVDFQSFLGADDWDIIEFNDNNSGGDIIYRVYYEVRGTPTIIPNAYLTGNASGFTTSPINISMLDPAKYPRIYIHATFSPKTASPEIYDWTVKARGGTLPVELKSFDAELVDQTTMLKWTTFSETNNEYFTIEKSKDGKTWNVLLKVKGAGNSNIPISYKEKDGKPYNPTTYYRLSQIDFNGTTEILGIHSVSMKEAIGEEMVNIYPNPAVNSANCEIISNSEKNILLKVINLFGQITYSEEISVYKGTNKIPINIEVLQGGSYLILVEDEYGIPIGRKKLIVK